MNVMNNIVKNTVDSYIIKKVNIIRMILTFGLILSYEICQIHGYGRLALITFTAFMLLNIVYECALLKLKYASNDLAGQILLLFFDGLVILYIIKNRIELYNTIVAKTGIYAVIIILITLVGLICVRVIKALYSINEYGFHIKRNYVILSCFTLFLSFILNLECFSVWARWDSYTYYNAVENLSANSLLLASDKGLIICGHVAGPFAFLSLLFDAIPSLSLLNGLYLMNMILMALGMGLFYKIVKKIIQGQKEYFYIVATILFGVSPYVFGTVYVINPEKILLVAILGFIYSILYNKLSLNILSTFAICQTKETGVLIVAIITLIQLLVYLKKKIKKIEIQEFNLLYFSTVFFIGVFWLIQFLNNNWATAVQSGTRVNYPLIDGAKFNEFGFSYVHIKDTIIGFFFTNFSWVFVILILLACIKLIIQKIKKQISFRDLGIKYKSIWIIIFGGVSFVFANCLFVTYHFFRYYTPNIVFLYLLGLIAVDYLFNNFKIRKVLVYGIPIVITVLLFIQSYFTIDPVMMKVCRTVSTGNAKLAFLNIHMQNFNDPSFQDTANYNRQIMNFDKALDKAYEKINPKDKTKILMTDGYKIKTGLESLYSIWGFGYTFVTPKKWCKWDNDNMRRYLDTGKNNNFDPVFINGDSNLKKIIKKNKSVYYIEMPWRDAVINDLYGKDYKISLFSEVEYGGWKLNVYRIE